MGIQQMLLAATAASKTYIDDLFNTHLYKGTGSSKTITNDIDLAGEGGLVWIKSRDNTEPHLLFDTVRGVNKYIRSNESDADTTGSPTTLSAFNNNGFDIETAARINQNNIEFTSWAFRKAPGLLDIVTYTGNGSESRTIDHSLGSVPGFIIFKRLDASGHGIAWHREYTLQSSYTQPYLRLNGDYPFTSLGDYGNDLTPTATQLKIPRHTNSGNTPDSVNVNGANYVAWVFAGGKHPTARSIGTGSCGVSLHGTSSDYAAGTGDFTAECWFWSENINIEKQTLISTLQNREGNANGWQLRLRSNGRIDVRQDNTVRIQTAQNVVQKERDRWWHVALVRHSGVMKLYVNGEQKGDSWSTTQNFSNTTLSVFDVEAGLSCSNAERFDGKISNVRFVKGQAVYTSNFRVPSSPLTTTSQGATASNVKLIACNGSTATSTTVDDGWTNTGTGFALSTETPFTDAAAHVFGENEDQEAIKCGSYVGNGNADGPEIDLGWEPQWLMLKCSLGNSGPWNIVDNMRQAHSGNDYVLFANTYDDDETNYDRIDFTSRGFKLRTNHSHWNTSNKDYVYIAIRRPDGVIGKPIEAGTDAFNVALRTGGPPGHAANFDVDMSLYRGNTTSTHPFGMTSRLMGHSSERTRIYLNAGNTEVGAGAYEYDYSNGWHTASSANSYYQSWMWRRHQGFDVVMYEGNGDEHQISHNLGKTPEMIWCKGRHFTQSWHVYHHKLNGGTNPEQYYLRINSTGGEAAAGANVWNNTAPTSTAFSANNDNGTNKSGEPYIACLFASVDGISKVSNFTGNGSTNAINCGFVPRFILIKKVSASGSWVTWDTVRPNPITTSSSNTHGEMYLESNAGNTDNGSGIIKLTSNGFEMLGSNYNDSGAKFIYYAHA